MYFYRREKLDYFQIHVLLQDRLRGLFSDPCTFSRVSTRSILFSDPFTFARESTLNILRSMYFSEIEYMEYFQIHVPFFFRESVVHRVHEVFSDLFTFTGESTRRINTGLYSVQCTHKRSNNGLHGLYHCPVYARARSVHCTHNNMFIAQPIKHQQCLTFYIIHKALCKRG